MQETKRYQSGRSNIGCDAKNCSYNDTGYSCSAEHIDVSGKKAECTGETCCNTFKRKN